MKDKVVIVYGAGGVGAELARTFSKAGALVVLSARREDKLAVVQQTLAGRSLVVSADASKMSDVLRVFEKAFETFGHIDAVVNAVGEWKEVTKDTPLDEAERLMDMMIDMHLKSAYKIGMVAEQFFREHGGGLIVNISSHVAKRSDLRGNLAYGAVKAGATHFMEMLGKEVDGAVRIWDILPTIVNTPDLYERLGSDERRKAAVQPDEIPVWIIEHFNDPDPYKIKFFPDDPLQAPTV